MYDGVNIDLHCCTYLFEFFFYLRSFPIVSPLLSRATAVTLVTVRSVLLGWKFTQGPPKRPLNKKGYTPYLMQTLDLSSTFTPGVDVYRFVDLILVRSCCTSQLYGITQALPFVYTRFLNRFTCNSFSRIFF